MRQVWTYWISRNSIGGELSGTCNVWYAKPLRVKHRYRVTWVAADFREPCHVGEYSLQDVAFNFRTVPDTDLELLKVEQWAAEKKA